MAKCGCPLGYTKKGKRKNYCEGMAFLKSKGKILKKRAENWNQ